MVSWPQGLGTVLISDLPDTGGLVDGGLALFLLCLPPMILAPRYLPRLAATIGLFTRYGLADFAKQQGLEGIAPEPGEDGTDDSSVDKATAFRKKLVELGPAYVKLGQVL